MKIPFSLCFAIVFFLAACNPAWSLRLIRDAEIENTLKMLVSPVFSTAGLDPQAVRVYIVQDEALNAFVAGGQKVFLHTGLLIKSETPEQLIGVVAHETGHIAGGHLARMQSELKNLTPLMILTYVLGAATAVGGSGDAGMAILTGGSGFLQRSLLRYNRAQERAADRFAVDVLHRLQVDINGLAGFMRILSRQTYWNRRHINPYMQTHPAIGERIAFLEQYVEKSPMRPLEKSAYDNHARMRGKLMGFLQKPQDILNRPPSGRPGDKDDLADTYARMVALYRLGDAARADALWTDLDKRFPDDPYLLDTRAQFAYESGRTSLARTLYEKAVHWAPHEPLVRLMLARTLLQGTGTDDARTALDHLRQATVLEPSLTDAWREASIAHGRLGQDGLAALDLAEKAYHERNREQLAFNLGRAEKDINADQDGWIRLQDLKKALQDMKEPKE